MATNVGQQIMDGFQALSIAMLFAFMGSAAINGHQVYAAICFTGSERETVFIKSGGCGYCKEDHVMGQALKIIGAAPIKTDLDNPDFWRYRLGGNFHKVPQSKMRVIK